MKPCSFKLAVLVSLFIVGFALRNLYLSENLLFGFEQGRDFFVAKDIASFNKFTLLGPKTDIEGIFHGVYYYYLLALIYKISLGNPLVVAFIFTFLSSLTIFVIYRTGKEIFTQEKWAMLSALIAAFSFNLIIYSRWISNVSLGIPIYAIFFYFIVKLAKLRKSQYLPFAVFFGFLLLHFEILSIFAVLTTLFFVLIYYRIRLKIKDLIFCFFAIFVNILPFVLFEIKHELLLLNGIRRYLFSGIVGELNIFTNLKHYFVGINKEIVSTLFPFAGRYSFIGLFFVIAAFFIILKTKSTNDERKRGIFLFFSVFGTFPLFFFLKYSSLEQFYVGASIPIILFFVFFLRIIFRNARLTLKQIFICSTATLIFINTVYTVRSLQSRNNIFYYTTQKEMAFGKKIQVIKYMQSSSQKYTFDAFTTPLYRPDGWHYLNTWLNRNSRFDGLVKPTNFFLVIEPFTDKHWLDLWLEEYNKKTVLINEKNIDGIIVQMRKEI